MTVPGSLARKTVRDIDLNGKRVLVRADLNVPLQDGAVADDTRIRESIPTLDYILEQGGIPVVCSHLGRPRGRDASLSLAPVAERLGSLMNRRVEFASDCVGAEVEMTVAALQFGDVLLLENLRFHPEEEANDPDFARQLAGLASVYVNDAFGAAHRAHASTAGVAEYLPAVAGLLLEKEIRYLGALVADPPRPFAAVVGGAKVSTKIAAIDHLLPRLDILVLGGGMANTFLKARGIDIGASLVEDDHVETARAIVERAEKLGVHVHLPFDVVAAAAFDADAHHVTVPVAEVPDGYMILDIGPESVRQFAVALSRAHAVIWNGPMGVFEMEPYSHGSFGLARLIARLNAVTVVGGGETAAVAARSGVADEFTHISTGGGASLEMLEGRELPGVAVLDDA